MTRLAAPGGPCNENQGYPLCSDEYFCRQHHLDGGPGGTCQRKAGLGDTCVGGGTCLPSLRCTTLITTGVCATKAGLHEGCVAADDCQDGLGCNFKTQRCSPLPADGGDCSYEASGYRCAPGHTCIFSVTGDDVCSAWKAPGLDCSYSSECASNDCEYGTLSDGGFGGRCRLSCSQRADGGLIQGP